MSAVLGFALRKLALFAAVLLCLFLTFLLTSALIPTLQRAEAERDRRQELAGERLSLENDLGELESTVEETRSRAVESLGAKIDTEVDEGRGDVSEAKTEVERLRDDQDELCGFVESLPEKLPFGPNPCADAKRALEKADEALDTFEQNLGRAEADAAVLSDPSLTNEEKLERLGAESGRPDIEREIDNKESELARTKAEEDSLRRTQDSWAGWVVMRWAQAWKWLAGIALLVIVMPVILRIVSYFLLMPLLSRLSKPVRLAAGAESALAGLRATPAERTLTIQLPAGEVLSARSEHVRPVRGNIRSRILYDWASPFISYAAGLYGLSRITGDEDGTSATLATPDDPDSYLMRIDFTDHPGLVIHPKHVVGVVGAPELETRWRWGIQSFATWQVRYIMFAGTGSLIVQGSGDVVATSPAGRSTRIEQNLVMGFDSRLTIGVRRTEVFWPYLWGRTPLVDDEFSGSHQLFWQKSSTDGPRNPIAQTFNAFFSALGKLFGF